MRYSVVNYHVLNAKNIREIRKIDKQRYLNSSRDIKLLIGMQRNLPSLPTNN